MNEGLAGKLAAAEPLAGIRRETAQALASHARERRLQAGETLLRQEERSTHAYVVVDGRLRATLDHGTGGAQELGVLEAGAVLGEIAVLAGGVREATVIADTAATVVEVFPAGLELLFKREPDVAGRLAALATARLRQAQLARQIAKLFPEADAAVRGAIATGGEWVSLGAGEQLVQRGDPADAAYIIVSGRLRALTEGAEGGVLADVGAGELVGEMALVEDGTRTATLVASRDTHVVRLRRDDLLSALRGHPETLMGIAHTALRRATRVQDARGGERRSVALVAVHPSVDLRAFASALVSSLHEGDSAQLLTTDDLDDALASPRLARAEPDGPGVSRVTQWLQEQEQRHSTLLLQADAEHSSWNEAVLRHADHVALVADATASPAPPAAEARVRETLRPRTVTRDGLILLRQSLVLLHPGDGQVSEPPRGTARWLAPRTVDACYHVRGESSPDLARFARIIAERPVGLVLSGGGARGFAHLGVVRALEEAGVPIDIVAGTSIGAVMGTFVALGLDATERAERAKATLLGTMDWTLPLAGLVKGARMAELADREVEGRDIEDFWLPWMAVSTNLTRTEVSVHRRGSIQKALRATVAIPGVVPPVVYGDELHVDGGVLDNLPVEHMRRINPRGPVIAVDVTGRSGPRASEDYGLSVSGWGLLTRRLLPGSAAPPVPSIATTLVRSMLAGSTRERDRVVDEGLADLHLDLDLPRCGLIEFDAAERIIAAGYDSAVTRVQRWAASLP